MLLSKEFHSMTHDHMLEKMKRGWAGPICGKGSSPEAVAPMQGWFPGAAAHYDWKKIADVGAGDNHWFPMVPGYEAFDLVPRAEGVIEFDCTTDLLPQVYDVVVCRWVLNHLSTELAALALSLLRQRTKMLLMSMFNQQEEYWRRFGMYPLRNAELLAVFEDHDGRKNKRMELYRL